MRQLEQRAGVEPRQRPRRASPIVGASPALQQVLQIATDVASSPATVLIEGESGTGKELLARKIHEESPRSSRALVEVNCAAIPEGLAESILFGHERGAFTGATQSRRGAFERAHGSSLILDEITEMRQDIQPKLLRVIQERVFERVGGSKTLEVDSRVIAITNRNLADEMEQGRFRHDLYYRLRVVPIRMPTLDERREDIPALVRHFVQRFAARAGQPAPEVSPEALASLSSRPWPGNVRELANAVERAVLLSRSRTLVSDDFDDRRWAPTEATPDQPVAPTVNLKEVERVAIERALESTQGNRTRAARLLGITDRTLRNKLKG